MKLSPKSSDFFSWTHNPKVGSSPSKSPPPPPPLRVSPLPRCGQARPWPAWLQRLLGAAGLVRLCMTALLPSSRFGGEKKKERMRRKRERGLRASRGRRRGKSLGFQPWGFSFSLGKKRRWEAFLILALVTQIRLITSLPWSNFPKYPTLLSKASWPLIYSSHAYYPSTNLKKKFISCIFFNFYKRKYYKYNTNI